MPEESTVNDLRQWFAQSTWDDSFLRACLERYGVTPETLLQRFTNLLPHHFGIEELFFIRLQANEGLQRYRMTKELHLAQLQSPSANAVDEHYCRRWVSVNIIKQARNQLQASGPQEPVIAAQLSQYIGTENAYLCLSIAAPRKQPGQGSISSVTIGLLVNDNLRRHLNFLSDSSLPTRMVNTFCERCPLADCEARVVPPLALEKELELGRIRAALQHLD